ncbi:MAG: hypothetical protein KKD38_00435, partial [Candidatus Delongbacteria bacterium]|nr:hypothetical protein [Candidatus Delongbacteria bacterium]
FDISENMGDFVVNNKSISFQDMQSIKRAFVKYFNIQIERNRTTNDIIFALASRHIIVHNSSKVDSKFLQQIKDADDRQIKTEIELDQKLQFETSEVEIILKSMINYFDDLIGQINIKFAMKNV